MKDIQCYELFVGIALKNHAFSFFMPTEKIELMDMEVCFWASQPALAAIKLKKKQRANFWPLRC